MAVERDLLNAREQRIALPNQTSVPGDNVLVNLARTFPGSQVGRFKYDEIVKTVGGLPEPFQTLTSGELLSGEDGFGTYF